MSKLPISVSPDDESENSLTVTFTKKDFSDFVFNLFVTPRDEKKTAFFGFDLFKQDLKKLWEKLNYHVQTHHEILNQSVLISVILKDGTEISYSRSEQFFDVDDPRSESVSRVSIESSYVIAFFREGKKSFEKQTVGVTFEAGIVGTATTSIRSTDVSWPNGVFALIERELRDLSMRTVGQGGAFHSGSAQLRYDFDADIMVDWSSSSRFFRMFLGSASIVSSFTYFFAALIIVAAMFWISDRRNEYGWVLSDDQSVLLERAAPAVVEEIGIDAAIEQLQRGEVLGNAGMPREYVSFADGLRNYVVGLPYWVLVFGATMAILSFVFAWKARLDQLGLVGRIFVFSEKSNPRETPSVMSSIIPSVALGSVASLLATVIWELLT